MVTFLDLPDAVRKQIYELAIYDHDRAAVFLPRALPRKVTPGIDDVDVECVECDPLYRVTAIQVASAVRRPWQMPCLVRSIHEDSSPAGGTWQEDASLVNGAFDVLQLPPNVAQMLRDDEVLMLIDGDSDDESDNGQGNVRSGNKSGVHGMSEELMETLDAMGSDRTSRGSSPNPYQESVHLKGGDEDLDDEGETGGEREKADQEEEDPEICHWNAQGYCNAHIACTDDADSSVFVREEHIDIDDEEHFDTAEEVGMLYEPREPSILLVSKQVRAQCLPLYYSRNAFSWRFDWTDYHRACGRFKSWAKSIDVNNVHLLTSITFQGRHRIEEGLEFTADIDLLTERPYFETSVEPADSTDAEIAQEINFELDAYLQLMAQYAESRPAFSAAHLCALASIFVQGMHRDAGGATHEDALPLRIALNMAS